MNNYTEWSSSTYWVMCWLLWPRIYIADAGCTRRLATSEPREKGTKGFMGCAHTGICRYYIHTIEFYREQGPLTKVALWLACEASGLLRDESEKLEVAKAELQSSSVGVTLWPRIYSRRWKRQKSSNFWGKRQVTKGFMECIQEFLVSIYAWLILGALDKIRAALGIWGIRIT